jgi:hypothetical protein
MTQMTQLGYGMSWISISISLASLCIALVALLRPTFANRRTANSLSIMILGELRIAYQHAFAIERAARDLVGYDVDEKFARNCRAYVRAIDIPTLQSIQKDLACFSFREARAHANSIVHWRILVASFGEESGPKEVDFTYGAPASEILEIAQSVTAAFRESVRLATKRTGIKNDLTELEKDALKMSEWIHAKS